MKPTHPLSPDNKLTGSDAQKRDARAGKLNQVLDLQDVLKAIILGGQSKPLEIASCVRSWDLLEERIRILRGRPLPGQLQPDKEKRSAKHFRRVIDVSPESVAATMRVA